VSLIDYVRNRLSRNWLKRQGIKLTYGIKAVPKNGKLILEEGASIHCQKMRFSELSIGAMTYVRSGSELLNVRTIGRFCSISNNVVIGQSKGGRGHPLSWVSTHPFQLDTDDVDDESNDTLGTVIGNDVWIGRDAMIMEGVTIGTGAVIAARSLVTHDVPEYAIVAGTPAKVIRYRHPSELVSKLLESRWWETDLDFLKALPMDKPDLFLESLSRGTAAHYKSFALTRSSWTIVKK
jgi:chloramphenicol O-acetyltransferase type B